jgi:glutathione S-transferase
MKLFYSPGSCSLAPHIVMSELGMAYELEAVDLRKKTTASGIDFQTINAKGSVPALKLDSGEVLTEGAVIMQYLADQKPQHNLLPKFGSMERYRAQEMLNFIATDLHKNFSPLWGAGMISKTSEGQSEIISFFKTVLHNKIAFAAQKLDSNNFLLGNDFSIVDAYFFTVMSWAKIKDVDYSKHLNLISYMTRVASRPSVERAMREEGLIK